jgi:uncharacterized protein with HEPN domain
MRRQAGSGNTLPGCPFRNSVPIKRLKDAVIRNFEIIGEATKNLPVDLRDRYPAVEWRQVAGLRDVMAHRYYRVDLDILWEIIQQKIPALRREIGKILKEEE